MLLELPEFDWVSARTVEEACQLLAHSDEGTIALAGGTDVFTKMKLRRLVPQRLIDIKSIPGLDAIRIERDGALCVGALATAHAIECSPVVVDGFQSLRQAAAALGTLQIRNTATIGGNLANASPSAEFAPPLLSLAASLHCVGCGTQRNIPLEQFFVGPGKTVLRRDEMITEICVPPPPTRARGIYLKHSLRKMDVAIASTSVLVAMEGDRCTEARIALGAVGPIPARAAKAEAAIRGQALSDARAKSELIEQVARLAAEESAPIDDLRADAGYRRKLVAMLVGKALERLLIRRA